MVAFLLLGKPLIWSLALAIIAGIAIGWIITGWESKELPNEQNISSDLAELKRDKEEKKTKKRPIKRYRRQPKESWFFWKNPRRRRKKRR
ncbi:hypothetical protein [Floridanema evergladense]|uniref:ATP synthase F0 subunit 8 n=1 Tax=Floridaenema evergladense BLCC-F167 TaxID=3153639 RepID=A0ABV4WGB0_9CYAN